MATGSPLLDQYDRDGVVTPGLQKALDITRQKLGQQFQLPGAPAPGAAAPTPRFAPPMDVPTIQRAAAAPVPAESAPAAAPTPPAAAAPAAAAPGAVPLSQDRQELTRLTTGPTGKSGVEQIHNPWFRTPLRVLSALGDAFVPQLTMNLPGTQLHHEMLVNHASRNVDRDEEEATAEANRTHLGAQNTLEGAQAKEADARAQSLLHPKEPMDWQQGSEPEIDPAHPELGAQSVFYNKTDPSQKRFGGASVAPKPVAEKNEPHYEKTADGSIIALTKGADGKSGYEVVYHGDPKVETDITEANGHRVLVNKQTGATIRDLGPAKTGGADHGVTMVGPDNTILRLQPGQRAPEGAMTPNQAGSVNVPTAQTRTMAETAPKVLDLATRVGQLIDQQTSSLGPAASRWNEFMSGKVGAPNPEFTKLRTDVGLLQTALMRMHVGARGGEQMMEHFRNLIDVAKQSPENLKAALGEIQDYAREVAHSGGRQEPGKSGPAAGTVQDGYRFKGGDPAKPESWEKVK